MRDLCRSLKIHMKSKETLIGADFFFNWKVSESLSLFVPCFAKNYSDRAMPCSGWGGMSVAPFPAVVWLHIWHRWHESDVEVLLKVTDAKISYVNRQLCCWGCEKLQIFHWLASKTFLWNSLMLNQRVLPSTFSGHMTGRSSSRPQAGIFPLPN